MLSLGARVGSARNALVRSTTVNALDYGGVSSAVNDQHAVVHNMQSEPRLTEAGIVEATFLVCLLVHLQETNNQRRYFVLEKENGQQQQQENTSGAPTKGGEKLSKGNQGFLERRTLTCKRRPRPPCEVHGGDRFFAGFIHHASEREMRAPVGVK